MRAFVIALVLCVPVALVSAPPTVEAGQTKPVEVGELLDGFAKMPGLYAEFRQEVRFGMLAAPLVDEGTIHFADGRLARRTVTPSPSVVVIDDAGIEYGDANGSERIDLDGKPAVRQFVDAFTKIFSGDRAGLEHLYRIEFIAGDDRAWQMTLIPQVSPMDKVIDRVEVSGRDLTLRKLRVIEHNGDETITTFTKVDTSKRYTEAEKAKVFAVE